jgi:hypothetical protein
MSDIDDLSKLDVHQLSALLQDLDIELEKEVDDAKLAFLRRQWSSLVLLINSKLQVKESV